MTITRLDQLTDDITEVRDAEGGTWTRQPDADVWQFAFPGIYPVTSVQLIDLFAPLTPTVAYHV